KRYTSSPYTCPFVGVCRRWAQSPPLVGLPYFNGRKGIDETPKCGKHEEAQQPPAESVVYTGCGRIGNLFHSYRHKSDIDRSYVAVYINYDVYKQQLFSMGRVIASVFGWGEHLRAVPIPKHMIKNFPNIFVSD